MKQATYLLIGICVAIVFSAQTSFALSPQSKVALDDMNKHLAKIEPIHERCKNALDAKHKLKPGVKPAVLMEEGKKLTSGVLEVAMASKKIDKADWKDPQVESAFDKFREIRVTLIHIGYAAPKMFLSDSGKSRADSMASYFQKIESYKEEANNESQRNRALHDIDNYLGRATRDYNAMSKEDRSSPNGQALANDLRLGYDYLKESREADKQSAANAKEAKGVCKDFKSQMATSANRRHMEGLIFLAQGQKPNRSYSSLNKAAIASWVTRINEQKAMLSGLQQWCTPEKLSYLKHCYSSHGKPRIEGLYAKTDPVVWCSVAENGQELMNKEFEMFMKRDDQARSKRMSAEELEGKEGWFAEDRAVEWKTYFFVTQEEKKKAMAEYGEILAALGAGKGASDPFESREATLKELREAVQRLAPKWDVPPKGTDHYGTNIAKQTVKRWYKGAKVLKAAGTTGDWTITKNSIGVPLYRSRFGWILFKVKGSPLCQLRTFALGEDYAGGGKYKKGKHVTFSKLRWQKCA